MTWLAWTVWVRLPIAAGSISRSLAAILADGCYLTRWPATAVAAPFVAVAAGAVISLARPLGEVTYTYEFPGLVVFAAIAGLSAALGLYVALAYAVCDFFLYVHISSLVGMRPALLSSYLLLAVLTVLTPLSARLIRRRTLPDPRRLGAAGTVLDGLLAAVVLGGLVFLWTQSAAALIRPIFVWTELGIPADSAIHPLQQFGWVLGLVAGVAAAVRTGLERGAGPEAPIAIVGGLRQRAVRRLPAPVAAVIEGAVLTFLLGGLLDSWPETAGVLAALVAISLVRRLLPAVVPLWPRLLSRIPMLLRVALGIVAAALAGRAIISSDVFISTTSLWPVAASAVVGMLVMAILLPDMVASTARPRSAARPRPGT
jgi:hypothetical protein